MASCEQPKRELPPWRQVALSYQARFPTSWKIMENEAGLTDSIQPATTLLLPNGSKITLHLFREEVPPRAQVARWQKQFPESKVTPLSHGGYQGLLLEGEGILAVAMQLSPHYNHTFPDYTLKATGDVATYRNEILQFIQTFELSQEL